MERRWIRLDLQVARMLLDYRRAARRPDLRHRGIGQPRNGADGALDPHRRVLPRYRRGPRLCDHPHLRLSAYARQRRHDRPHLRLNVSREGVRERDVMRWRLDPLDRQLLREQRLSQQRQTLLQKAYQTGLRAGVQQPLESITELIRLHVGVDELLDQRAHIQGDRFWLSARQFQ